MNREEFEAEYIRRYMKADPFREAKASIESLRVGDGYADQHIDLCWKVQQIKNENRRCDRGDSVEALEW
jgi:hypothetical protein